MYEPSKEQVKKLRQQALTPDFRDKLKRACGEVCVNCGESDNIEYHHIVPVNRGGTNALTNIVPSRVSTYEAAEPHLKRYYACEIGTIECKQLIGTTIKNTSAWYRLRKEYEERHTIPSDFFNNIDILNAKKKRGQKQ